MLKTFIGSIFIYLFICLPLIFTGKDPAIIAADWPEGESKIALLSNSAACASC